MCKDCLGIDPQRRKILGASIALAGLALFGNALLPDTVQAQPARAAETPDEALKLLTEGNDRYVSNNARERDFSVNRVNTAAGQAPFASVLGCSDSRVAPELAFDQRPGDLFVVRVAGNFVTDEGLGSLEFGSAVLGAKLILVLGHSRCGAVTATIEALQKGNQLPGHIAGLASAMKPGIEATVDKGGADLVAAATIANVRYNVSQLEKTSPILADLIAKQQLRVVGGVYDLATGKVTLV
ncbi:carbonic anhydrase [Kaistia terrae]|uniref:carbonic anhydrase n=1 Tax=Kaistia terrae TaxID=537017 RepID=A0ABW0Q251_9HYPH|nr:carbonic anhydrase [Kaistia terrae]MCX5579693.1 carbonic anhydrase [Kaistia terrae]